MEAHKEYSYPFRLTKNVYKKCQIILQTSKLKSYQGYYCSKIIAQLEGAVARKYLCKYFWHNVTITMSKYH